jgi:hypothetical protein
VADRIEPFAIAIPALTAIATPLVTATPFSDGVVAHITITVPPGPSGFVGFRFTHNGGPVIPYTGAGWIIADDRIIEWDVANMPTADGWEVTAYNTDIYLHTIYVEYLINEIAIPAAPRVALLDF